MLSSVLKRLYRIEQILPFMVAFFSTISHYPILIGDRTLNIIIHFTDEQEIKIENVIEREINSETYKVITSSKTFVYPMPKISFVEVQEK